MCCGRRTTQSTDLTQHHTPHHTDLKQHLTYTLITHHSSHTTHLTQHLTYTLISRNPSHITHVTPLVSHHSFHATALTPLLISKCQCLEKNILHSFSIPASICQMKIPIDPLASQAAVVQLQLPGLADVPGPKRCSQPPKSPSRRALLVFGQGSATRCGIGEVEKGCNCATTVGRWKVKADLRLARSFSKASSRSQHHSSHTTLLTPLISFISHHSSLTTHLTPLISHHPSHTTHLTPLSHHSSHTTHLTPLISQYTSHTTHVLPLISYPPFNHHLSHTKFVLS